MSRAGSTRCPRVQHQQRITGLRRSRPKRKSKVTARSQKDQISRTRSRSWPGTREHSLGEPQAAKAIAELELLATLLDSRWRVPGTSIRFEMDALLGLVPVLGDAATGLVSAYIVLQARNCGAEKGLIARMLGNVLIDTVVGSVPILGSIFDVYFRRMIATSDCFAVISNVDEERPANSEPRRVCRRPLDRHQCVTRRVRIFIVLLC